jgi:hypothetical protein
MASTLLHISAFAFFPALMALSASMDLLTFTIPNRLCAALALGYLVFAALLPYQTMLAPMAAVLAKLGQPKTAEAGAQREKLKRWFWCGVFGQAYEKAPNSQSARDVRRIPICADWRRHAVSRDSCAARSALRHLPGADLGCCEGGAG